MKISKGIYEQIINQTAGNKLRRIDAAENLIAEKAPIDDAEAQHISASYMVKVTEKGLHHVFEESNHDSKAEQIKFYSDCISKPYETSQIEDLLECKADSISEFRLAG